MIDCALRYSLLLKNKNLLPGQPTKGLRKQYE